MNQTFIRAASHLRTCIAYKTNRYRYIGNTFHNIDSIHTFQYSYNPHYIHCFTSAVSLAASMLAMLYQTIAVESRLSLYFVVSSTRNMQYYLLSELAYGYMQYAYQANCPHYNGTCENLCFMSDILFSACSVETSRERNSSPCRSTTH